MDITISDYVNSHEAAFWAALQTAYIQSCYNFYTVVTINATTGVLRISDYPEDKLDDISDEITVATFSAKRAAELDVDEDGKTEDELYYLLQHAAIQSAYGDGDVIAMFDKMLNDLIAIHGESVIATTTDHSARISWRGQLFY